MTEEIKPTTRLLELDALRGVAALMVVFFHFTTRYDELYGHVSPAIVDVPWGHYGVQFFFVISGFVIFMTLYRTRRPLDFVISRFSRLFPAYWAAIVLTSITVALGGMTELQIDPLAIVANFSMLQNWMQIPSADGVYWSLFVELTFYVCMFVIYRMGLLRFILPLLLLWVGTKWLWAYAPSVLGVELPYRIGVLVVQKYVPFFAIGIVLFHINDGRISFRKALPYLTFFSMTVFALDGVELGVVAVLTVIAFLAALNGLLPFLRSRVFSFFGAISYSLYLLHENIGWTIIKHLEGLKIDTNLAICAALITVIALSTALTYLFEKPALKVIRSIYKSFQTRRNSLQPVGQEG